ncbi:hypothetical protein THAOC_02336 [Thalassiosira oceanica]|uniref:RING-type domain-containing protein n=1 Tax=Thalassiosira oceanica TaxID=159749 RepID=K0TQE8_THAOC|nr:hypothetical protein THAOC_02336 [Thalassiosira oceanica]|eukprot:EJK75922.1 hypothetical protein THAOC_02336 [Thalassiosira oceanica]
MKLTAPPSGAPSPPPSESGVPSSPPSGAPSPHLVQNFRGPQTLSDANSGAGKPFGASYHGENPTFYSSDAELKEFIAFVGECAVSLMNKFFPRKHSFPYRLTQTVNSMVRSLDGGEINDILDGNRNADWEFLESLFGPTGRNTGVGDEEVAADLLQSHRRMIMADILAGGVSVRALVERQHERRMAKGRKIVAILKETSVQVAQHHLIEGETNMHESKDDRTVDIELGAGKSLGLKNDSHARLSIEKDKEEEAEIEDSLIEDSLNANQCSQSENGAVLTTKNANTDIPEQDSVSSKECGSDLIGVRPDQLELRNRTSFDSALSSPQPADSPTSRPDAMNVNESTAVPPRPSSLYDDLDSFQEDDKYSGLCIPCTKKDNMEDVSREESRFLPPTCAICLTAYQPQCYVSWSPNKECQHAFHRDCILTWLLKQDEPLCPCCRRPFILPENLDGSEGGSASAAMEGQQQQPATDPRASLSLIQHHYVGAPWIRI